MSAETRYPTIGPGVCGHIHEETRDNTAGTTSYRYDNEGPYAMWEIIKEEVTVMLDIIKQSKSAYCSPVVIFKKKDGSNRFFINFRKLNLMTRFDTEPMGNPDDIIAKLHGNKFFTKIDLSKGYWQIQIHSLRNAQRMLQVKQDALRTGQLSSNVQSNDEEGAAPGEEHRTLCG